ncbi:hypothetical protein ACQJBY_005831 [Aegilops geniculata]
MDIASQHKKRTRTTLLQHAALPHHGSSPQRVLPGHLLAGSAASISSTVVASPPCLLPQPLSGSSDLHQVCVGLAVPCGKYGGLQKVIFL